MREVYTEGNTGKKGSLQSPRWRGAWPSARPVRAGGHAAAGLNVMIKNVTDVCYYYCV